MVQIDAAQLLDQAHRLGFEVCRDGDRLHVEGPQDAEWFVAKLAEAKPDILASVIVRMRFIRDGGINYYSRFLSGPRVNRC